MKRFPFTVGLKDKLLIGLAGVALASCGGAGSDEKKNQTEVAQPRIYSAYDVRAVDGRDIVLQAAFKDALGGASLRLESENSIRVGETPMKMVEDASKCLDGEQVCYQHSEAASAEAFARSYTFDFTDSNGRHYKNTVPLMAPVKLRYSGVPVGVNINQPLKIEWDAFTPGENERLRVFVTSGNTSKSFDVTAEQARSGTMTIAPENLREIDVEPVGGNLRFERTRSETPSDATIVGGSIDVTVSSGDLLMDFSRQ